MAVGFLFDGVCRATLADATAAYHAKDSAGFLPGTTSYILQKEWNGSVWVVKRFTLSSGGTLTLNTTTNLPVMSFPTCDTSTDFMDGLTIGWGVAGAVLLAGIVMAMRRGLP